MEKILMVGLVFWMVFGICSPLSRAHQGETHATVVQVMRESSGLFSRGYGDEIRLLMQRGHTLFK